MTQSRTGLMICSLLGLALCAACAPDEETSRFDASVSATPGGGGVPGTPGAGSAGGGSTGTAGGGSGGAIGAGTGGSAAGTTGGAPAGASGGATAGAMAGATAGLTGGATAGTSGGTAGVMGGATAGTGGATAGTGGATAGTGGATAGTGGGTAGTTGGGSGGGSCPGLPPVTDYSTTGPFGEVMTEAVNAGSEGCTLFRPGASLGMNGFKHPIAVWGNGITTTPSQYRNLLSLFASHGIVTIACNSTNPERPCLNACMDWLVQQNGSGAMAGKLDVTKEFTIGYSWGGGAAIDTATRPNVKATVSFHGMPPRQNPWAQMKAPLLLFTSTGDTFVNARQYVTPNYNSSMVPTFYATLNESVSHTYVIDRSGGAAKEKGPAIAFLLYFGCNDQNAKKLFFGSDCTLCKSPWTAQMKPPEAWQ